VVTSPERRLVVRPDAAREATRAYDWYEDQSPGLGAEFLRALEAVFGAIRRAPALYPVVRGRTRRALVRRFPYGVFYAERDASDPSDSEVVVLAIVHSRRHPRRWQSRAAT
jgi:plasmid stabilization system protein ParE